MGCGNMFFAILISISVALITYNILISANASLKQEFPGRSRSSISVDPIIKMPLDRLRGNGKSKRLFHTAVTASDSVYNAWQCRIMYYWFKKFRDLPNSEMGGFTRVLHSGKPDNVMDEIPTFVAQPLPAGMDQVLFFLLPPQSPFMWTVLFGLFLKFQLWQEDSCIHKLSLSLSTVILMLYGWMIVMIVYYVFANRELAIRDCDLVFIIALVQIRAFSLNYCNHYFPS